MITSACKKTLDTQIQPKRATDYCIFPKALSFSGLIIQHFWTAALLDI